MKNIIVFIALSFLLVGCSMSSLKLGKDDQLVLSSNSQKFLLSNKTTDYEVLNYKDLLTYQYKLEDEKGRILFYEESRTSLEYEFNFSALYTVMSIFDDSRRYEDIYQNNNLRLVQLELKDASYVNVLLYASDTQIISYVYGFSNEEFLALANSVNIEPEKKIELKHKAVEPKKPLTNWNDKLVYFTPLITPFRAMGGF